MSEQPYRRADETPNPHDHNDQKNVTEGNAADYWRANLRLLAKLLTVWFIVSFGCGILFVDWLDQFSFFGFKLGFWFAQQGAIYIFVALIFIYAWRIEKIERQFGLDDAEENSK